MQMGDIMKGSCLTAVRKDIDLRVGKVVHYNVKRLKYSKIPINIEIEDLSVPKKENLWDE